jgi:hypothetical protein
VIKVATMVFAVLTVVLGALAYAGREPDVTVGLAISSAIISATFAFSNWFAGRARLRIDEKGLYSRLFYREHMIPWAEISMLFLRYVFLPGVGGRIVYYCVRSPIREFAFPGSLRNSAELQAMIESATGLRWPAPEITATL